MSKEPGLGRSTSRIQKGLPRAQSKLERGPPLGHVSEHREPKGYVGVKPYTSPSTVLDVDVRPFNVVEILVLFFIVSCMCHNWFVFA